MDNSIQNLVRSNILRMQAYSSARSEFSGQADTFLDANENPFNNGMNRYPDPLQKTLKQKIASLKKVKTQQIFLGNGSDEAIDLLIRIFCVPQQDHIITLPPTYGMYKVGAALSDVENKTIPLKSNFQPDVKTILATANTQSKLLFICSPNNPTGNDINRDLIIELLENFQGIVVVDEAYIDFSTQETCLSLLEQFPNLVVLQTFSKAWGLAGIRLGMAFASPEIVDLFNKVKPPYNINSLTQQAANGALDNPSQKEVAVQEILNQRKWLSKQLTAFNFVKKIYPSAANFLLIKMDHPRTVYEYLLTQKIIIRDRSQVLLCDGCLRFTIGTAQENKNILKALQNFKK